MALPRIQVGVLTHNPIAKLRFELLQQTIASLHEAFPPDRMVLAERVMSFASGGNGLPTPRLTVFDNGSTDGTGEWLRERREQGDLSGFVYVPEDGNTTPGRGENLLVKILEVKRRLAAMTAGEQRTVFVLSDDDMRWKPGAADKLARFWAEAPEDLVIVSGLLEPEWHWNTPRATVEHGEVRALVRDSAPGAAWSFRADDVPRIFPLIEDFGQDYEACCRLRAQGLRVAQMDLAEHVGWGVSTHGNEAIEDGKPLDRERWGI